MLFVWLSWKPGWNSLEDSEWRLTYWGSEGGELVDTMAFSWGFHLQILWAILGYRMKMSLCSGVYSYLFSSATEEEQGMAECYLFVGKCQEGFLNIADESRFLREEGPTCKKSIKSFYCGLWYGKCFCLSLYPIRYIWHHMYFGIWELFDSVTKVNGVKRKWCKRNFKKYRKPPLEVKILWNNYLVLLKKHAATVNIKLVESFNLPPLLSGRTYNVFLNVAWEVDKLAWKAWS